MNTQDQGEMNASVRAFVSSIRELHWVRMIALDNTVPFTRLWTIISAPPFNSSYRRPIYDAQAAILSKVMQSGIEFRLVNVQEVEDDLADILPSAYETLFRQEVAA